MAIYLRSIWTTSEVSVPYAGKLSKKHGQVSQWPQKQRCSASFLEDSESDGQRKNAPLPTCTLRYTASYSSLGHRARIPSVHSSLPKCCRHRAILAGHRRQHDNSPLYEKFPLASHIFLPFRDSCPSAAVWAFSKPLPQNSTTHSKQSITSSSWATLS